VAGHQAEVAELVVQAATILGMAAPAATDYHSTSLAQQFGTVVVALQAATVMRDEAAEAAEVMVILEQPSQGW
jgi:hypothetical protein